jgi:hypothetical protein
MMVRALVILISCAWTSTSFGQQAQCDASAFREVVSSASASISKLHEKNNKIFQENLQKLRAVNHWSEADYLVKATPLVKDETTAALDTANETLLVKVQSLEAADSTSEAGRCTMLAELKISMEKVVANTAAKWDHILSKLAQASAKPLQAGVTQ